MYSVIIIRIIINSSNFWKAVVFNELTEFDVQQCGVADYSVFSSDIRLFLIRLF